jgi:hypothetical protein
MVCTVLHDACAFNAPLEVVRILALRFPDDLGLKNRQPIHSSLL